MRLFKNKKILGGVYFLNKGERIGQFLYFLRFDEEKQVYSVLTLPECEPIFISKKEMEEHISNKDVEFVEKPPKDILKETILEFEHRISLIKQ